MPRPSGLAAKSSVKGMPAFAAVWRMRSKPRRLVSVGLIASGPSPPVEAALGLRRIIPIEFRPAPDLPPGERDRHDRAVVAPARLEDENLDMGILGQPIGQHAASRSGAHDHIVERGHVSPATAPGLLSVPASEFTVGEGFRHSQTRPPGSRASSRMSPSKEAAVVRRATPRSVSRSRRRGPEQICRLVRRRPPRRRNCEPLR